MIKWELDKEEHKEIKKSIEDTESRYPEWKHDLIRDFKDLIEEVLTLKEIDENKIWEDYRKICEEYLVDDRLTTSRRINCENVIYEITPALEDVLYKIKLENKKAKKKIKITEYKR